MKPCLILAALFFVPIAANAQAAKPCEELKSEIVKKLDAKGVTSYTLEVVTKDKETDAEGKVVGTCDGGTRKLVYRRTAEAHTPAAEPTKQ
jgi:hypothetical protein